MIAQQALHDSFFTKHPQQAATALESFHKRDIADVLKKAGSTNAAALLTHMNPGKAADVLTTLPHSFLEQTLPQLASWVTTSLFHELPPAKREELLKHLPSLTAEEVTDLMSYPADSAGRLVEPSVLGIPDHLTVEEAISHVREQTGFPGHDLYILDHGHKLVGQLSPRNLLLARQSDLVRSVMHREVVSVHPLESQEQVATLFQQYDLTSIPVVDSDNHFVGVIRHQALKQAWRLHTVRPIFHTLSGISMKERFDLPILSLVQQRLPFLQTCLLAALLIGAVVWLFEGTISSHPALAALLPVILLLAIVTGNQSFGVVRQHQLLGDLRVSNFSGVGWRELRVSVINGALLGLIGGLAIYGWSRSIGLALTMGMGLIGSISLAGLTGALIPLVLFWKHRDAGQPSFLALTMTIGIVSLLSLSCVLGAATIVLGS